ncbi:MAG: radical SAM protein [Phycisphaeraceae bacterium]|nr:radical SAM protein [Phycisphaeraceae bacterium]
MSRTIHLELQTGEDPFARRLADDGQTLMRDALTTLQLNLGKLCNLACHHCHVEAGPKRPEIMDWAVFARILDWLDRHCDALPIEVVDLTGGAPEMNPEFRRMVRALKHRGLHVLDRCNLTILLDSAHADLVAFMARHEIEIVASLPCYLEDNVDAQRGNGVYDESIEALRILNDAGYGRPGSALRLDLVYNPVGYGLPPDQQALEDEYRRELRQRFGIEFNRLWTITNMPIKRFEHALRRDDMYDAYMSRLHEAHNPHTVDAVMCRSLISVGWEGSVYDCDFNQMLQMSVEADRMFGPGDDEIQVERESRKLWTFAPDELVNRPIRTGGHCFGCTAGAGSSCTGALG